MKANGHIVPLEFTELPEEHRPGAYYRLLPKNKDPQFYKERTDRNIGWITHEEQEMLSRSTIGIAGCGGMGGLLGSIFVRLGIGEVRIADSESFDASNINRQFGARRESVGRSKAFETARMIRSICDDSTLVVYPQGICESTASLFAKDCDLICDEIEFWAVAARILLHREARLAGVSVFNCNTVGFGTRLFLFEPDGFTMEETLGLSYDEAKSLEKSVASGIAPWKHVHRVMESVLEGLVPELPEYGTNGSRYSTIRAAHERLFKEHRAMIIATNPPMAAGFLADHTLFHLLRKSRVPRALIQPPPAPGYLYFDAALHTAKAVERNEVRHER